MSSPTEPSHGAPNTPQHGGLPIARDDDQYKAPRKIAALRAISTSLLTRALASAKSPISADPIQNTLDDTAEGLANLDLAPKQAEEQTNKLGLSQTSGEFEKMATTVAALPNAMSAFGLQPNTSWLSTRGTSGQPDYRMTSSRNFVKNRPRGTSLERTQKEKRVQEQPKGNYTTNPGDTALPPLPTPTKSGALSTISNNPPTDGVRARYRSWRDAHPPLGEEKAWSIGKGGSHDHQEGKVEKSVAEALAGIEPNNRSRKASHSLRFFREGLPEEKTKKKEKGRGRSSEKTAQLKDFQPGNDAIILENEELHISRGDEQSTKEAASSLLESTMLLANDGGSSLGKMGGISDLMSALQRSPQIADNREGYFDLSHHDEQDEQQRLSALPAQLLHEIRKHHNLTPGAERGTSFSKSIPVTISEKLQSSQASSAEDHPEEAIDDKASPSSPIKSQDEDEESGEEQISSALFVPHQAPHESPDHEHEYSPDRQDRHGSKSDDPEQWLVEHEVPTGEVDQQYFSDAKVEIQREKAEAKALQDAHTEIDKLKNRRQTSESDYSDIGYSTKEDESSLTDDPDLTPTGTKPGHYMSRDHNKRRREQQTPKAPLEAIELIPYRHQVGGHTTMWRFSKRAVCKQLNNRENEFYEKVEQYHPKLLKFLPRYIGVLNVTFEKQQKRKSSKKDSGTGASQDTATSSQGAPDSGSSPEKNNAASKENSSDQPRMISHALQTTKSPIPTVTFADNRHIIPSSFLQPTAHNFLPPRKPSLPSRNSQLSAEQQSAPRPPEGDFTFRPTLADKHAVSWGATTVNKKLRNEVFGEAFLQQPIPIHRHKKPASSHRNLPLRKSAKSHLRSSNSESSLVSAQQTQPAPVEGSMRKQAMKAAAERRGSQELLQAKKSQDTPNIMVPKAEGASQAGTEEAKDFEEKAGTSAPEPDVQNDLSNNKKKRRYSSGGLRRKPEEANAEDRGDLKYFEEADDAGYKGDGEDDVFKMDPEPFRKDALASQAVGPDTSVKSQADGPMPPNTDLKISGTPGVMLPAAPNDTTDFPPPLPRPVNPKEAQTQPDSRVEYFLLLEDLTAGMKRPCIMDLKMGTRQYGVEANEKKQKSQRQKCATTTSQELGVRVCGLQVWDAKSQSYVFQDKYFGRNLKAGEEFQEALTRFLYDGLDYHSVLRHIPTILAKLQQLEAIIRNLNGYRFYAASLLLFYDGDDSPEEDTDDTENSLSGKKVKSTRRKEIDFKIADFANCVTAQDVLNHPRVCPPKHPGDPDRGFLRGLRSLRSYFLSIQRDVEKKVRDNGAMGIAAEHKDSNEVEDGFEFLEAEDEGEVSF